MVALPRLVERLSCVAAMGLLVSTNGEEASPRAGYGGVSHHAPMQTNGPMTVLRVLPRGPHRLGREVVEASQRGRLLDAMAQVVAGKGYGATSVADVIATAGVSRKTFYEHFRDKLDCFLAAYDLGVEVLLATVRAAGAGENDPLAVTRARTRAYLRTLSKEPASARTFLVDVAAAGPEALERRRAVHRQFAGLAREIVESIPGAP